MFEPSHLFQLVLGFILGFVLLNGCHSDWNKSQSCLRNAGIVRGEDPSTHNVKASHKLKAGC